MGNNLETFEKLFYMSYQCLESLRWNIHKHWRQALIVMKITVEKFEKIVKSRDVEYFGHKGQNSLDANICKSDVQVDIFLKSYPVLFLLIRKD